MFKSVLFACLVVAAGCKDSDKASAPAAGSQVAGGETGNGAPAPRAARDGKIPDLGLDRKSPSQPAPNARAAPALPGAQADGSGEDFRARMAERRRERMAAMDADGDGAISDQERATARAKRAEDLHARLDADGNGKLTVDELGASRRFSRIDPDTVDANKDGDITSDELAKALASQPGPRGWRRGDRADRRAAGGGSAETP